MKSLRLLLALLPLIAALGMERVQAQSITPAPDGTHTLVTPSGNRIDIRGGQTSKDGANLFHSFEKFGLNQNEIANFLSNPTIQNILGRVVGGKASLINGLIQVSGGNSNLFLMNPAGIIFGPNVSLNLPADFAATTADGIGFGANWFKVAGENNYAALIGTPDAFAFTMSQPRPIVNAGNLNLTQGHNLTLVGGTVVSIGQLSGPGGQITVSAVPGKNMVRLSQPGNLLSLDIPITPTSSQPNQWKLPPVSSLAKLLTGNNTGRNLRLQINSNGQAEVTLSGIPVRIGDVVARNVTAQTATLSANRNLTLVGSQLSTTGDLNLLAKDTVRIRDSVANPFVTQVGGNFYIQGNQGIDILALNHPQTLFQSGGNLSLVSDGNVSTDAHFVSGGDFSITSQLLTQAGNVTTTYPDGSVVFTADNMDLTGNITSGRVTLQPQTTGQRINLGGADADGTLGLTSVELNGVSTETLQIGSSNSGDLNVSSAIAPTRTSTLSLISGGAIAQTASITVTNLGLTSNGPMTLNSPGNHVDVLAARTHGGDFSYIDSNNIALDTVDGITGITTVGGNIDLTATAIDTISTTGGPLNTSANDNAGNITLTSTQGDIEVSSVNTESTDRQGGNVTINSNQFFRTLTTLPQRNNASISAVGVTDGGSIEINQAGGLLREPFQPFVVGDSTVNGTAGDIVTSQGGQGNELILRTDIPGSIIQGSQDLSGFLRINTDDPERVGEKRELGEVGESVQSGSLFEESVPTSPTVLNLSSSFEPHTREAITSASSAPPAPSTPPAPSAPSALFRQPPISDKIATSSSSVTLTEFAQCRQFEEYFGIELQEFAGEKNSCSKIQTAEDIRNLLKTIAAQTGKQAAIVYISPEAQELKLTAYFSEGAPVTKSLRQANRKVLLKVAREFRSQVAPFVTDPVTSEVNLDVNKLKTTSYLASAQQLYQWLIAPLEVELQARGIDTLGLSVGTGLRSLPLAALHDGQQFLVEKYSIGLIPSLNLIDTRYQPLQNSRILAMGASTFTDLPPLPAVPVEVRAIIQNPWQGQSFLNENFTANKLKAERQGQPFNIVHLATHAEFRPGEPGESFIQLGNVRLGLDQLRQLQLDTPKVELLTLSACQTALGDEEAELGFAGLALAAGVKTAVGSLWTVSDVGTLSLMTEFYRQLRKAPIKAEALQQVQIAMLKGQVRLEGNQLIGPAGRVNLPPDTAKLLNEQIASYQGIKDLGHPYFWSAFTMIGSPW